MVKTSSSIKNLLEGAKRSDLPTRGEPLKRSSVDVVFFIRPTLFILFALGTQEKVTLGERISAEQLFDKKKLRKAG